MATKYHNVTGNVTKELLAAGNDVSVSSISFSNVHTTDDATISVWIQKKLVGNFYLINKIVIPSGATIIWSGTFKNTADEFGLYIKMGAADSAVDVIIS